MKYFVPKFLIFLCSILIIGTFKSNAADLPHVGYAYPSGGQQGTSVEARIGGENIYGTTSAAISGSGVTVEILDSAEPVNDKNKDKKKKKKNQTVIDEIVKLKFTISPDAEPGDRDLRLVTPNGISNKLVFQIGQLKEVGEVEPNEKKDKAVPIPQIPATANGQIMPGDVDNFKFTAKKGQKIVVEVAARSLIPYIADAVPGWFQATLTLYNSQGKELAFADDFRFNPDPVMFFDVPDDGDYVIEIRDSIYRGRADFVYRLKIGELPFITSIFPLGARHGEKPESVKVTGRNIDEKSVNVEVDKPAHSIQYVSVKEKGILSNSMPFAIGQFPEILEVGTNRQKEKAQKVSMPVVINGRINIPGEKKYFSFEGKKDQPVAIEVIARRLGSPLDSNLILFNSKGEKIAENDDVKDKGEGMITHLADSAITQKLPESGTYTVEISDTQSKAGDEYAYRLRISEPSPDFELRSVPANISVPKGGSAQLTVHAIRRDDFKGEIKIAITGESGTLSLDGAVIPEGTDKVRMTVSASEKSEKNLIIPKLTGSSIINGKTISHPVIPAEDLMQAFIYQHLVPSAEQIVAVTEPAAPLRLSFDLPKGFLELPEGKEISFKVSVVRAEGYDGPIQLQLVDPPKGITLRKANIPAGKNSAEITIRTEAKHEAKFNENLIINGIIVVDREEIVDVPAPVPDKPKELAVKDDVKNAKSAAEVKTESKQESKPENKTDIPPAKDNNAPQKDVIKDIKENAPAKDANETPKEKKIRKERIIITAPAIQFRIVPNPEKKKTEEKKDDKKPEEKKADASKDTKK